jgi:hypothetical protein
VQRKLIAPFYGDLMIQKLTISICLTTLMMGSSLLAMEQGLKKSAIETAQCSQEELNQQLIEAATEGDKATIAQLIAGRTLTPIKNS